MTARERNSPEWREFERLVARIEADAGPLGLKVTSPDRIRCKTTGRLREVDASIRNQAGGGLVTIECRKRRRKEDVTWIEQLAGKKLSIGADRTIAVSASGFSADAEAVARFHGIDLRLLSDVSVAAINQFLRLDFVLFTHKRCSPVGVGIRLFRGPDWTLPDVGHVNLVLAPETDPFLPIFRNTDTGAAWCLNDLWLQLQEATDPFIGIMKDERPVVRTAGFPYPGNVAVETPDGPKVIGDVLLSVALWLEVERIGLDDARKVEYESRNTPSVQRVEFTSRKSPLRDWRISLQIPKESSDIKQLRTGGNWPGAKK